MGTTCVGDSNRVKRKMVRLICCLAVLILVSLSFFAGYRHCWRKEVLPRMEAARATRTFVSVEDDGKWTERFFLDDGAEVIEHPSLSGQYEIPLGRIMTSGQSTKTTAGVIRVRAVEEWSAEDGGGISGGVGGDLDCSFHCPAGALDAVKLVVPETPDTGIDPRSHGSRLDVTVNREALEDYEQQAILVSREIEVDILVGNKGARRWMGTLKGLKAYSYLVSRKHVPRSLGQE